MANFLAEAPPDGDLYIGIIEGLENHVGSPKPRGHHDLIEFGRTCQEDNWKRWEGCVCSGKKLEGISVGAVACNVPVHQKHIGRPGCFDPFIENLRMAEHAHMEAFRQDVMEIFQDFRIGVQNRNMWLISAYTSGDSGFAGDYHHFAPSRSVGNLSSAAELIASTGLEGRQ
ncbi:MAG TPA: hypothetical protein VME23_05005 [Terracidiphilus sp.]|nr:hypothetical protein [Terracidiphilus sp.]